MLDEGLCHVLATDAHNIDQRAPRLAETRELIARRIDATEADNLVLTRPRAIIENVSAAELPSLPATCAAGGGAVVVAPHLWTWPRRRRDMRSIGNLRTFIVAAAVAALSAGCSTEATTVKTTATADPAPAAALASVSATEGDYQISSATFSRSRYSRSPT